jgi:hypothetical protein
MGGRPGSSSRVRTSEDKVCRKDMCWPVGLVWGAISVSTLLALMGGDGAKTNLFTSFGCPQDTFLHKGENDSCNIWLAGLHTILWKAKASDRLLLGSNTTH